MIVKKEEWDELCNIKETLSKEFQSKLILKNNEVEELKAPQLNQHL